MKGVKAVGKIIRDHRKLMGIRQIPLSKACGISQSYLALLERGERNLDFLLMNKIFR